MLSGMQMGEQMQASKYRRAVWDTRACVAAPVLVLQLLCLTATMPCSDSSLSNEGLID